MAVQSYSIAGVVDATAQTAIILAINDILGFIGGSAADGGFTDGDKIPPALDAQINEEFADLITAIDAASEA